MRVIIARRKADRSRARTTDKPADLCWYVEDERTRKRLSGPFDFDALHDAMRWMDDNPEIL